MSESFVETIDDKVFQGQEAILEIFLFSPELQEKVLAERWMFDFNKKVKRVKTLEQCMGNDRLLVRTVHSLLQALPFLSTLPALLSNWQVRF